MRVCLRQYSQAIPKKIQRLSHNISGNTKNLYEIVKILRSGWSEDIHELQDIYRALKIQKYLFDGGLCTDEDYLNEVNIRLKEKLSNQHNLN